MNRLRGWRQDRLFRRVLRNTSYLFASSAIGAVLSIVTANMLGVAVFGVLGVITSFVGGINRLFSFRMGDVVVKYMSESLARGERERAAAIVKAAMLVESLTSAAAFALLLAMAPLAARFLARDESLSPLFVLYGISIIANIINETSLGVLQATNHYRSQALVNLVQSLIVAGLIVRAYYTGGELMPVLWAYLIGKIILGMGPTVLAMYWLPRVLGRGWLGASWSHLPPRGELARFAISTNFSGTINLIARDSEVSWVGLFFGPTAAGYFKTALAIINLIIMPINPFISTTYPEITRAYASRAWDRLRSLLGRVTLIAGAWTGAVALGLLLFGRQILFQDWTIFGRTFHIYQAEFAPAYPVLLILMIGFGAANILFWNRPLVLAQGLADYPLKVSFWAMLAKVGLAFILLPGAGYLTEAALLTGYFLVSVGLITRRGLAEVQRQERAQPVERTAAEGRPRSNETAVK